MLNRQAFIFYSRHLFPEAVNLPGVPRLTQGTQNAKGVGCLPSTKGFPLNNTVCLKIFLANIHTSTGGGLQMALMRFEGVTPSLCLFCVLIPLARYFLSHMGTLPPEFSVFVQFSPFPLSLPCSEWSSGVGLHYKISVWGSFSESHTTFKLGFKSTIGICSCI